MYTAFLVLHSWLRWVALAGGIAATASAATSRGDAGRDRWGLLLIIALDLQLLIGLLLYFFVSPTMDAVRANFGEAMRTPQLRFWAVEHITGMLLAVVLAHLGRVLGRKAATPAARRKRQLVCYGLATVLMLLAMPWPGMSAGRPLFRF